MWGKYTYIGPVIQAIAYLIYVFTRKLFNERSRENDGNSEERVQGN